MMYKRTLLAALAGFSMLTGVAVAQPAVPPSRVRGTISKIDGNMLSVKQRSGPDVMVTLLDDLKVVGAKKAEMSDVKAGIFIGTATVPQPDGTAKALEVTLFPASMNGSGEGSYAWDLGSNSTMTNGTIGDIVMSSGRMLTVKYNGSGEKKILVPEDVPVVLLNPDATKALLVVGAHVVVIANKAADGSFSANRVIAGENGVTPPM